MIALSMIMLDLFAQCTPQGTLAEEDQRRHVRFPGAIEV
jgi:hypothetical protein